MLFRRLLTRTTTGINDWNYGGSEFELTRNAYIFHNEKWVKKKKKINKKSERLTRVWNRKTVKSRHVHYHVRWTTFNNASVM